MRLPAVAMAASFAAGIALGLWWPGLRTASSPVGLRWLAAGSFLLIVISFVLVRWEKLLFSALCALCVWGVLGWLGAAIAQQPRPGNFVLNALQSNQIDLHVPLRWRVQLLDEPSRLSWGWRYELALKAVEFQGKIVPISGGLRLSYAPQQGDGSLAALHAGDTFWVVTQARLPQVYRDAGAFDRRAYLTEQNIELVATLRAPELIESVEHRRPTLNDRLARVRAKLRGEVDALFPDSPDEAGILRAMLLGDRTFIDRREAIDFQKTGVFHVLVVAGLHVAAFAAFLYWAGRKLRFSVKRTAVLTLIALATYVVLVEQRPPVLRAALMAAVIVIAGCFFRRLDLLNSAAVAALILLVANPLGLRDSSFQLSFLAIGCIGGLGIPWLDRTVQPYARALRGWRDVTRDAAHPPKLAQFRIDLRSFDAWVSAIAPSALAPFATGAFPQVLRFTFRFWELFLLTLVLQIGMLPILASDFHRVTLAGPLVNLIAVPLTGLIVPLGFAALFAALLWRSFGFLVAVPLRWAVALLLRSVEWFAHFPRWSYRIPGPPAWIVVLFFVAAVALAVCVRYDSRGWRRLGIAFMAALLAIAAVIAIYPFSPTWTPGQLELNVLDVGQGDSLFLVSPKGHTLLIDGGGAFSGFQAKTDHNAPDPGEEAVSPYLWSRGFKRVDTVALTHAHQDHAGGLLAILENFNVGALWIGRQVSAPALQRLEGEAKERDIPIIHESRGTPFVWDGVELQFLWPETSSGESGPSAKNDDSLVLHLRYGDRSMLLPGDAEQQSEREILGENSAQALHADILKVGHHGSTNSTTPDFLAEVRPEVGIISVGEDNPYGHPSAELLARLREAHVRTLRTDRNGAIQVLTDGRSLKISCFAGCPGISGAESLAQRPSPESQQSDEQK